MSNKTLGNILNCILVFEEKRNQLRFRTEINTIM